jgi:serine/threonine-protein kinase
VKADPARWARLSTLLDELLAAPATSRGDVLRQLSAAHPELADELVSLATSASAAEGGRFLTGHVAEAPEALAPPAPASLAGQRLGAYVLEAPLGQGGTGSVWRARRDDGRFEGRVAIKLLHFALLGRAGAERFRREGDVLARLTHPNIARLLDAGVSPAGQPFLVIEFVDGERIDVHAARRQLSVEARLALFDDVLAAVAHAHANLVVHRDLKPQNVLVADDGRVKLLDFGIAKLLDDEAQAADATALTREAGRVLTPAYAAPEQLAGAPITTATDVHGLGLLLHELLAGQPPPRREGDQDLPPPSRSIRDAAVRRRVAGELDAIVTRATKARPAERYPTVAAFADDLARHREGRPVLARRDSAAVRVRKWVQRNRAASAVAAGVVLALVGGAHAQVAVLLALAAGVLLALRQAKAARAQAAAAQAAQQRAEEVKRFVGSMFTQARPREGSGGVVTAIALLESAHERIGAELAGHPAVAAELGLLVIEGAYRLADPALCQRAMDTTLPLAQKCFGPRHPLTLRVRAFEMQLASWRGDMEHVLARVGGLIEDLRADLPAQAEVLASALSDRAFALAKQGREAESLADATEAARLAREHLGADHADTVLLAGKEANTLQHFGRWHEATRHTEAVMQEARRIWGHARPHSMVTEHERLHAYSLRMIGRPADAEVLARQVVEDQHRLDAAWTSRVAHAQSGLAACLLDMGRVAEAIALAREVAETFAQRFPEDDFTRASFESRLAQAHLAARDTPGTRAAIARAEAAEARATAGIDAAPGPGALRHARWKALALAFDGHLDDARRDAAALAARHAPAPAAQPPVRSAEAIRVARLQATIERLAGDPAAALAHARAAAEAAPRPAAMPPLDLAHDLVELGLAWLGTGDVNAAAATLQRAAVAFDEAQVLPRTLPRADLAIGLARLALHHGDAAAARAALHWLPAAWAEVNPGSVWHAEALAWLGRCGDGAAGPAPVGEAVSTSRGAAAPRA